MFVFYANIKEMIFILGVILPSLHSKGVKKIKQNFSDYFFVI